jgi:hypothetical protein
MIRMPSMPANANGLNAGAFKRTCHNQRHRVEIGALRLRWVARHDEAAAAFQQRPSDSFEIILK